VSELVSELASGPGGDLRIQINFLGLLTVSRSTYQQSVVVHPPEEEEEEEEEEEIVLHAKH
jgi:hypothetical protein